MKKSNNNKLGIIFTPIIFCLVMCLALTAVVLPKYDKLSSLLGMFISDTQIDYSSAYENIFVPTKNSGDTVNAEDVDFPGLNKQFGKLSIEGADVDAKLFYGDGTVPLRNGVGIYGGSFIPGYGKTILVAGHNNTYFNGLKNVKKGDIIKIRTSYGNYEYKITDTAIHDSKNTSAYDLEADYENLILYTCYPFDGLGLTNLRFFVYAEKVKGPEIVGLYE
ncbi:MAG: class D sortase [Ruminococcus sp.]|nr:class D sortase [Ruminococcus sp.]